MTPQPLLCWHHRSALALALGVALVSAISGCGSSAALGEVEGVVLRGGKPLPDVKVTFHPDPEAGSQGPSSVAYTDSAGRYRLSTDSGVPGAVVGTHRVCLSDLTAKDGSANGGQRGTRGGVRTSSDQQPPAPPPPSRVPSGYSAASDTPFRGIAVRPGAQTIDLEVK
jgi:hypothetical protein